MASPRPHIIAKQLLDCQDLFARLSALEYAGRCPKGSPERRLTTACTALSSEPEAYALGLLYYYYHKPGRRDVSARLLTHSLAEALAASIINECLPLMDTFFTARIQRQLDKTDYSTWGRPLTLSS